LRKEKNNRFCRSLALIVGAAKPFQDTRWLGMEQGFSCGTPNSRFSLGSGLLHKKILTYYKILEYILKKIEIKIYNLI